MTDKKKYIKDLFCKTYDIGEEEVKVVDFTDDELSVKIEDQTFHYRYGIENNVIRFKPTEDK